MVSISDLSVVGKRKANVISLGKNNVNVFN